MAGSENEDTATTRAMNTSGGDDSGRSGNEMDPNVINDLMNRIRVLEGKDDGHQGVSLHGVYFGGEDDVESWCDEYMDGLIQVGCITDVFNFLNRIKDGNSGGQDIKHLVDMDRVKADGAFATSMEAFMVQMPKLCGNPSTNSSFKTAHVSYLPGIPSYKVWDNPKTKAGIRYILKANATNVSAQIKVNIRSKLANNPVARSFSLALLSTTKEFVSALSAFITETMEDLVSHDYDPDLAWSIITQVIHHMFTVDMDKERSFVREQLDTRSQKSTAVAIMWGWLRTHRLMEEYSRHGIENHPSVAAQYVKFLVQNRVDENMKKTVEDAVQLSKDAKSMAASASNGLDQMKKNWKK